MYRRFQEISAFPEEVKRKYVKLRAVSTVSDETYVLDICLTKLLGGFTRRTNFVHMPINMTGRTLVQRTTTDRWLSPQDKQALLV